MNKKIKVIELLNRISKGENPTFRKHGGDYKNSVWTFIISYFYKQKTHEEVVDWLNSEVEILENEEEIDIQKIPIIETKEGLRRLDCTYFDMALKTNEIIDKVNKLDKKINNVKTYLKFKEGK